MQSQGFVLFCLVCFSFFFSVNNVNCESCVSWFIVSALVFFEWTTCSHFIFQTLVLYWPQFPVTAKSKLSPQKYKWIKYSQYAVMSDTKKSYSKECCMERLLLRIPHSSDLCQYPKLKAWLHKGTSLNAFAPNSVIQIIWDVQLRNNAVMPSRRFAKLSWCGMV